MMGTIAARHDALRCLEHENWVVYFPREGHPSAKGIHLHVDKASRRGEFETQYSQCGAPLVHKEDYRVREVRFK